jgi:hypothetical protein
MSMQLSVWVVTPRNGREQKETRVTAGGVVQSLPKLRGLRSNMAGRLSVRAAERGC